MYAGPMDAPICDNNSPVTPNTPPNSILRSTISPPVKHSLIHHDYNSPAHEHIKPRIPVIMPAMYNRRRPIMSMRATAAIVTNSGGVMTNRIVNSGASVMPRLSIIPAGVNVTGHHSPVCVLTFFFSLKRLLSRPCF